MNSMRLVFLFSMTLVADDSRLGSNLDFEQAASPSIPSWSQPRDGYDAALDPQNPASGKQSMRLRYANAPPGAVGSFSQSIPARPVRGKRLVLSGLMKTQGVRRGIAALWARTDDASGQMLALANMGNFAPAGTTSWQRYETGLVVSPTAETIVFGGLLTGDGAGWFDDLRLSVEEPKMGYNLDFEDRHPSGPTEWNMAPRLGFRAFLDSDHPQSGKYSLCIDGKSASPGPPFAIAQRLPAWKLRSKLILVTVFIKTENVTGQASFYIDTLGPNLGVLARTPLLASAKGNSPWTRYEMEYLVSPTADMIGIGASLAGPGTAWFDNFNIEVLEIH